MTSPNRVLLAAGVQIKAFDPEAQEKTKRVYADQQGLTVCKTQDEPLNGTHALRVVTE